MAAVVLALVNAVGNVGVFLGPYIYGLLITLTGNSHLGLYLMGAVLTVAALLAAGIEKLPVQPRHRDSGPTAQLPQPRTADSVSQ
jgi:nitrate/nitrite transporter NarK